MLIRPCACRHIIEGIQISQEHVPGERLPNKRSCHLEGTVVQLSQPPYQVASNQVTTQVDTARRCARPCACPMNMQDGLSAYAQGTLTVVFFIRAGPAPGEEGSDADEDMVGEPSSSSSEGES